MTSRLDLRERGPLVVHVVTLVAAGGLLLWLNRGQWFFGDDWAFLADRSLTSFDDLMRPHNEHWSLVPVVVFRLLFRTVGLHSYLPYAAAVVLTHLAVVHVLWRVMRRAQVDAWVATAVGAAFAVYGSGYENLLFAANVGFNTALALGLGQVLLVSHDGGLGRRDVVGVILGVVALAASSVAVVTVGLAALTAALRRRFRAATVAALVPGTVYVAWLATYGDDRASSFADLDPGSILAFVGDGLSRTLEGLFGLPQRALASIVVGAVLVGAWGYRAWEAGRRPAIGDRVLLVTVPLGAVVSYLLIAAGRTGALRVPPESSRYLYTAAAFLVPLIGLVGAWSAGGSAVRRAGVLVLVGVMAMHSMIDLRRAAHDTAHLEQQLRRQYVAAYRIHAGDAPIASPSVDVLWAPNLGLDELEAMVRSGAFDPSEVPVGPQDRIRAAAWIQVDLTAQPFVPVAPREVRVAGTARFETTTAPERCLAGTTRPTTQIALTFDAPAAVELASSGGGELVVVLADVSGAPTAPGRIVDLPAQEPRYLEVTRPGSTVYLDPPDEGTFRICGVRDGQDG